MFSNSVLIFIRNGKTIFRGDDNHDVRDVHDGHSNDDEDNNGGHDVRDVRGIRSVCSDGNCRSAVRIIIESTDDDNLPAMMRVMVSIMMSVIVMRFVIVMIGCRDNSKHHCHIEQEDDGSVHLWK
jgi:hypothetical protein